MKIKFDVKLNVEDVVCWEVMGFVKLGVKLVIKWFFVIEYF